MGLHISGSNQNLLIPKNFYKRSEDVKNFLSHHLWIITCSPAVIVKYLRAMFEKGSQYRTINFIRSSISKLHQGFGLLPAGEHPYRKQACEAAFRLRPPFPKNKTTFRMKFVLEYVATILGNNVLLTLKWLTRKTIFLIAFSSLSRVSTISRLGSSIEEHPAHIIVPILSLEKQARGIY